MCVHLISSNIIAFLSSGFTTNLTGSMHIQILCMREITALNETSIIPSGVRAHSKGVCDRKAEKLCKNRFFGSNTRQFCTYVYHCVIPFKKCFQYRVNQFLTYTQRYLFRTSGLPARCIVRMLYFLCFNA